MKLSDSLAALILFLGISCPVRAQDMPLFKFLNADEPWTNVHIGPKKGENVRQFAYREHADGTYSFLAEVPDSEAKKTDVSSLDGGTRFVGYPDRKAIWAFRVNQHNDLLDGAPYAPLRLRRGQESVLVTALLLDTEGRIYAATPLGIQVFDPTGRLSGLISLPIEGIPSRMHWIAKDHLLVRIGNAWYARKLRATGAK